MVLRSINSQSIVSDLYSIEILWIDWLDWLDSLLDWLFILILSQINAIINVSLFLNKFGSLTFVFPWNIWRQLIIVCGCLFINKYTFIYYIDFLLISLFIRPKYIMLLRLFCCVSHLFNQIASHPFPTLLHTHAFLSDV